MARDLRSGTTGPPKPKQQPAAAGASIVGAAVAPRPPVARPHRALQAVGYQGGIQEFNNRVQQAYDAHRNAKGFDPSPGVVFDVARSHVPTEHIPALFGASILGAKAAQSLQGIDRTLQDKPTTDELYGLLQQAVKTNTYRQFMEQHGDQLKELRETEPRKAMKFDQLQMAGLWSVRDPNPKGVFGLIAKGVPQIAQGLVLGPPQLAWEEGRATYKDVGAVVHGKLPTHLVTTNKQVAKGVVRGVARDVRHPSENPGYLFLDVFGALSGGAGAATRLARAGAAAARHEGAVTATRALVERPRGGRIAMTKGEHTVERLGSENMLVNAVQRVTNKTRNARMERRSNGEPTGFLSIVWPERLRDRLEKAYEPLRMVHSDEAKMRRENQAQYRVEHAQAMVLKNDLARTAGWDLTNVRAWDHLPKPLRKGLTVGEQKALQVITLDDPNPLVAWQDFHRRMIDEGIGDPEAHRAHLAALQLAQKVLANPSKRFRKAADLYYETIAEQERLKMQELGLSPDLAEKRVIAAGQVVRSGQKVGETPLPASRLSEKSTYAPFFSKLNSPRKPSERGTYFEARQGPYGLSIPRDLAELHHQFTGESLQIGDFRLDATTLAGESYARTVRLTEVRRQHKDIWNMSSPTRMNPTDRPVRDVKEVPDKLKETLQRIEGGDLTGKEVDGLTPTDVDTLIKFLYPERVTKEEIDGVRWVEPALLHVDRAPMPTAFKYGVGVPNEFIRVPTLFGRPAYILNAIGNAGMALLHQGHHAPPNVLRGIMAKEFYGERISHLLDSLGGESHTKSFTDNRLKLASSGLARGWSVFADNYFRRGAVIHELRRLGYDIPLGKLNAAERANLEKILSLKDEASKADVIEASRRGNKSMVEFNNLTWAERELIKHLIFVYPWVSRSLVWSIRSIVEHPIKADILAQVGHEMDQEHPELYKNVPAWFAKTGYVPIGWDKNGNPKVINPTSVNSFTTLSQMLSTVQAGFDGSPSSQYNQAFDLLGPTARFLVRGVTGKDDYGNQYPDGAWMGAAREVLMGLPQISAYQRGGKANNPLSAVDITKRDALIRQLNENMKRTVFSPGWADGYGMLVTGGLTPRTADEKVLYAKYWADATPAQRHKYEVILIHKAFQMQAGLLKTKVPPKVREGIDLSIEMSWRHKQQQTNLGRGPTELEKTQSDIALLTERNLIPEADAKKLLKKAKGIDIAKDLSDLHSAILGKYARTKELQQWGRDVNLVASFTKPLVEARLAALGDHASIKKVTANQETLYEAGRQTLSYQKQLKEKRDDAQLLPHQERDVAMADLRAWEDGQDHPIKVNGKTILPSPVRMTWAQISTKDRTNETRSLAGRSWGSMTNFQKEIVGKKVPAKVSAAWAIISELKTQYKQDNYTGATSDQIEGLVKQMDKQGYAGILQDYLFSKKAKIRRLEVLAPYTKAPQDVRNDFNGLVGDDARKAVAAIDSGNYTSSDVRQAWTNYVNTELQTELAKPEHKALKAWLEPFGPDFLSSLIGR